MTRGASLGWLCVAVVLAAVLTGCGTSTHESRTEPAAEDPAPTGPSAGVGPSARPAAVCARDTDCVLIAGDCSSPEAVDEPHARERARRNTQRLSVGECRGGEPGVPVRAACTSGACTTTASDHPEWRLCAEDSECVHVPRRCGGWDVVTRRSERDARATFAAETPGCTTESPAAARPAAACRYGFCAFDWRDP